MIEVEEDCRSQSDWNGDTLAELKDFIRAENARSNRTLTEDIRKCNEERISALENSLSFALATNETLAKRLTGVEARAQQAENDFRMCVKRISELEQELDQLQQRELKEWLIFSGPAIPRLSHVNRREDAPRLLRAMLQNFMGFDMDAQQVAELRREERQICVRFSTSGAGSDRYLLLRNKTKLRGSGLYIREKLTPARQQLFNKLMQLKREDRISTVFTRDGTVFAVVGERDRPCPVRSDVALERLIRDLAEVNADHRAGLPDRRTGLPDRRTGLPDHRTGLPDRRTGPLDHRTGLPGWRAGPLDRRTPRSGGTSEETRRGRSSTPWDSPALGPGHEAAGPAACPDSSPDPPAEGAGASTERERSGGADAPAGSGAAEAERVSPSLAPAPAESATVDGDNFDSGSGGADRPLGAPGGGSSGGRAGGGGGGAGAVGRDGGRENDRHREVASERAPASTSDARPAAAAAGVRRRFVGDIRQFVRIHSKCD